MAKFRNLAMKNWQGGPKSPASPTARALWVADVDGDGRQEILIAGASQSVLLNKPHHPPIVKGRLAHGGELRVFQMSQSTLKQLALHTWSGIDIADARTVCAADVDGDGKLEIVTGGSTTVITRVPRSPSSANYTTRAHLRVFNWDGKKLAPRGELVWVPRPYAHGIIHSVCAADIDADGKIEILAAGQLWVAGEPSVAWFEAFNLTPSGIRHKGRRIWQKIKGQDSGAAAVGAADVDGDGHVEVVTAVNVHWGLPASLRKGEIELSSWRPTSSDAGLTFSRKATARSAPRSGICAEVRSMHIGDVDGEKGIEIVTVGVERQGPEGDPTWLAGGLQVWRASGSTFTSINQLCVIFTRTYRMGTTWYGYVVKKTAHFLTTMDSVYADVLAGSSKKLLLITGSQRFRLSQGNSGGGYLMAMEAGKNYEQGTSGKRAHDIFPRFVNFAFESPTGVCGFTYPNGVMTADVNNDTKREIVTSGYNVVGSTGSFVACWR